MSNKLKPITVVITCTIKSDMMEIAKRELQSVIKTVMIKEKACRGIRVHENSENPQRLLIIEYWDSKEVFLGPHMHTPHMEAFLKLAESFLETKAEFNFWNEIHSSSPFS